MTDNNNNNNVYNFSAALEKIAEALESSVSSKELAEREVLKGLYNLSLNPQRQAVQFLVALLADKRFNKLRSKVVETVKAFSNFEKVVQVKSKSGQRWVVVTSDDNPLKFAEPVREFYKAPKKTDWTEEDYNEAVQRFNQLWAKRLNKTAEQA